MLGSIIQIALGTLFNSSSKSFGPSLHKLVIGLFGFLVATILASCALVAAVIAAVLWLASPLANPVSLCVIIAAALGLLATTLWLVLTRGQTAKEMVDEALETPSNPLDKLSDSFHHLLHAFNRGWQSPKL